MEILVRAERDLTKAERQEMDRAVDAAFEADYNGQPDPVVWVQSNDWHVLVYEQGRIVSHVAIVERTVLVDDQPVRVGGIGAVATLPEMQGRGLAGAAMRRAAEFMRATLQLDFGLLFCDAGMLPLYQHLGWQRVAVAVLIDQPQGKVPFHEMTMFLPCQKQNWPEGIIDICGLPW
jgi:aminoglycoside 2'-N-acetyltransferase I